MANYLNAGSLATSSSVTSGSAPPILTVTLAGTAVAPTLRRTKWYDILVGTNATPADAYLVFNVSRVTATSANATIGVANPLDAADGVSVTVVGGAYTAGCSAITSSSTLWQVPINQRASYRWVAAPGSELVTPATASNGLALIAYGASASGPACMGTVYWQEQ